MRKMRILVTGFALLILLSLCVSCGEQRSTINVEADTEAIKNVTSRFADGLNEGDLNKWIAVWSDSGIQMPPDVPATFGKENIMAEMQPMFDNYDWEFSISDDEIRVAGDWAFTRGTYTYKLTPKQEGKTITGDGKYISIFERQPDGSWLLARDCYNDNAPMITE